MKTKGLEKLYDRLSPQERVPLFLAAAGRGDEADVERLVQSAPTLRFRVPNSYGLSEGLFHLVVLHRMTQLELAARFWQATALLAEPPLLPSKKAVREHDRQYFPVVRLLAFQLVAHAEAWELFCGGLQIDPELLLRDQPRYGMVQRTLALARSLAFSAAEALEFLRQELERAEAEAGPATTVNRKYRLETAEEIARHLQEYLDRRVESWS